MSTEPSDGRRFTRITNPVTPSVHTFSAEPTNPGKMTRITNVVPPTVHTFEPLPILTIVLRRGPGSDDGLLPQHAALLIHLTSELDRGLGGNGFVFDPDGTREEPTRLALRLIPKLSTGARERLQAIEAELSQRAEEARTRMTEPQTIDIRAAIQKELAMANRDRLLLGAFERVIELAV